jgi:hypothetical protein
MFVEVPIHKLTYQMTHERFYSVKSEVPVTCVSNVTVQDIGRVNAMHERSRFGGAIIANRNLTRSSRLNVMKGHVDRANVQADVGTAVTDAAAQDTGRTSVTHVFRDGECEKDI